MTKKPTTSYRAADLRTLLDTIQHAITLPYDAFDYDRRILDRTARVRTTLSALATEVGLDIPWEIDRLQRVLAEETQAAAERQAAQCARCHKQFDPSDPRFDGHARHRETTWCRRCIDNCHNGGTEHVCVICEPARYGGAPQ
ncbi:hypothetical protein [Streptomyces sp. NPDC094468]|uniref:hypothetical protein n=1 Tax=Streptomyces sp. NPDC094468 TaxID=3366066 RepID=UPI003820DE22